MVLSREQSITLFHILQEGLTNVARHAQATNVHIRLELVSLCRCSRRQR